MTTTLRHQLEQVPTQPGIYQFFDQSGELLYVGKAVNLRHRVKSYFAVKHLSPKTQVLVSQIAQLKTIVVHTEVDALILEANLIKQHRPRYNIILKDDKSHLYIGVTLYQDLPRVITCRATDLAADPRATYFGPYPSSGTVKRTLRYLRRVFPYVAHHQPPVAGRRRPPQSFFYYNLPLGPTDAEIDTKRYRQEIFQLVRFLEGQRLKVAADLEKEMQRAAKQLDFERAGEIKRQLEGLNYIAQQTIAPDSYLTNPELVAEQRAAGLQELSDILAVHMPQYQPHPTQPLHRIECYDISNLAGQQAVGSMVVFEDGQPLKRDYRKFKIRRDQAPNDTAMMAEVLRRRGQRLLAAVAKQSSAATDDKSATDSFSAYPDLILVDGGKGQVSAAISVLQELGISVPVVGLSKRHEELILPRSASTPPQSRHGNSGQSTSDAGSSRIRRSAAHGAIARSLAEQQTRVTHDSHFTSIRLARGSEALFVIQRIRDEAHRFAIGYHRKLRSKALLSGTPE